jgi:hypothetical protein
MHETKGMCLAKLRLATNPLKSGCLDWFVPICNSPPLAVIHRPLVDFGHEVHAASSSPTSHARFRSRGTSPVGHAKHITLWAGKLPNFPAQRLVRIARSRLEVCASLRRVIHEGPHPITVTHDAARRKRTRERLHSAGSAALRAGGHGLRSLVLKGVEKGPEMRL